MILWAKSIVQILLECQEVWGHDHFPGKLVLALSHSLSVGPRQSHKPFLHILSLHTRVKKTKHIHCLHFIQQMDIYSIKKKQINKAWFFLREPMLSLINGCAVFQCFSITPRSGRCPETKKCGSTSQSSSQNSGYSSTCFTFSFYWGHLSYSFCSPQTQVETSGTLWSWKLG